MGEGLFVYGATKAQVGVYYIFVILSFLYLMVRYRKQGFSIYVILIFYNGLMGYLGKDVQNYYKIAVTLLSLYWLIKTNSLHFRKFYVFTFISFLFFSITFLYSSYLNQDYFFIVFSQYSRYFIVFVLFLIFINYRNNIPFKFHLEKVIFDILSVQILLSILKFFIMGPTESLVGSVRFSGRCDSNDFANAGLHVYLVEKGWFFGAERLVVYNRVTSYRICKCQKSNLVCYADTDSCIYFLYTKT